MAAVALQALNQDVGAVRLERDTIVAIVDDRVLNNDVVAAVSIPSVL